MAQSLTGVDPLIWEEKLSKDRWCFAYIPSRSQKEKNGTKKQDRRKGGVFVKWRYEHPELVIDWLDDKGIVCTSLTEDENYTGEEGGDL